jgi:hypothetical protein
MSQAKAVPFRTLPDETVRNALGYIAGALRAADLDEIRASLPGDPGEALMASAAVSSRAWLMVDRTGLPMGVCGVAPSGHPRVGQPWMVGTDDLEAERIALARQTRGVVAEMHEDYPILTNFVDARNDAAIDWLLWAGFHLIDADPRYGPEERLFLQFSKVR